MNTTCVFVAFLLFCYCFASHETPYTKECNGQGIVYIDSNYSRCECFDCYYGQFCETFISNCPVNVAGGESIILSS